MRDDVCIIFFSFSFFMFLSKFSDLVRFVD